MRNFYLDNEYLMSIYETVLQINKRNKEICFFSVSPHVDWMEVRVAASAEDYNNILYDGRFYYRAEDDCSMLEAYQAVKRKLLSFLMPNEEVMHE